MKGTKPTPHTAASHGVTQVASLAGRPKILVTHQWRATRGLYGADKVLLRVLKEVLPLVEPIVVIESEGEFADAARAIPCTVVVREMGVLRRKYMNPIGLVNRAFHMLTATVWLARFIRQHDIQFVFTSTVSVLAGALAAKLTRRPHVWLIQEILSGSAKMLSLLVSNFSTRIIAVSDASAQSVHRGRPKLVRRTCVAYPGVDTRLLDQADGASIRQQYCSTEKPLLIGLIGRLHYWKGQDYFLDALHELKSRGVSGFRALIVGDVYPGYENLRETLREKSRRYGLEQDVIFCGHRMDVYSIFKGLDIVVTPSILPEPFGLVVAEGMAAGRPVIATAGGGPKEIIEDGVSGILIPVGKPDVFSQRLEQLIRDAELRQRIGRAGRKKVEARFPAQAFAQKIRNIVESLNR